MNAELIRSFDVNSHTVEIVRELCGSKLFPSFELVISILYQRYGVADFCQLCCGALEGVPALVWLSDVSRKVDVWLRLTAATRSIVSLYDLDWECYQYLKSFVIPPFPIPNRCFNVDPCEVNLDEPGDVATDEPNHTESFDHFGIGSIGYHPLLSSYFICGLYPQDCLGTEQVLQYLLEYLSEQQQQYNGHNHSNSGVVTNSFNIERFIVHLCHELSVSDLAEVGVYIQGDLRAERLALQHVVHCRYRLFVETTKAELALFNQQMHAMEDRGRLKSTKRTKRKRREQQEGQETQECQEQQEGQETQESKETQGEQEGQETQECQEQQEGQETQESQEKQEDQNNKKSQEQQESQETQECQEHQEGQETQKSQEVQEQQRVQEDQETQDVSIEGVGERAAEFGLQIEGAAVQTAGSSNKDDIDSDMDNTGLRADSKKIDSTATARQSEKRVWGYQKDFESKMGVFWSDQPSGQLSSQQLEDIYTVENAELQGLLPFLSHPSAGSSVQDSRAAGRWGEALVFQYLLSQCVPRGSVHWLNQIEESRAAYDFIVTVPIGTPASSSYSADSSNSSSDLVAAASRLHPGHTETSTSGPVSMPSNCRVRTEYVEVKTTRFVDRNVFELSPAEWQFASADSRVPYHIYRVYSAGDAEKVRIVVVRDIYARVQEGRIKLCMAV